jgi:site-specific DNA recombinase
MRYAALVVSLVASSIATGSASVSLAFLAPDIVRAAINGKLPRGVGVTELAELPLGWADQGKLVGA